MNIYEYIYWSLIFLVFYTYVGYGIVLIVLVKLKALFTDELKMDQEIFEPQVTLFVAAFNERDCIEDKVRNMFMLDYPRNKMQFLFVTDGSDDGSPDLLKKYPEITLMHKDEREGKIAAINRGMRVVKNPIIIFSDANAMLNPQAIREIVKHYKNPKVGCVSGEKRIYKKNKDGVSAAGEGIYWRYESFLKKYDFKLYSAVGAAGELFSVRKSLHQDIENDTLLDDFIISLRIAQKGYKIAYEPNAYAYENASVSIGEEMKRKIRISAGGIQSILRLIGLLNFMKYGVLSFQYISHRVLRWTIAPLAVMVLLPLNYLITKQNINIIYDVLFYIQLTFYAFAIWGWYLKNKKIKYKFILIPFYFLFMNICVFMGFFRFIKGNQSVLWEKAQRA